MQKKHLILFIGLAITGFALWYTTRGVDWAVFRHSLGTFNWLWMIPALATFYGGMYLRAVRWGMLFLPHHRFSGAKMFPPTMICFAFNSILPGRVGEVIRAVYVGKHTDANTSTALATVVAERIFDAVCLLAFLSISLTLLKLPTDQTFEFSGHTMNVGKGIGILIKISIVLTAGVIVFMIPRVQLLIIQILRRTTFLPHKLRLKLEEIVGQFARGFHALAKPAALIQIVAYSLIVWILCALSNWCVAKGFGPGLANFHVLHAFALMTLIGIFILIPAAPGYWGLYEAGGVFSLITILRVVPNSTDGQSLALAYTLMIHLVQYIPIVIIGLIYAAKAGVSVKTESTPTPQ